MSFNETVPTKIEIVRQEVFLFSPRVVKPWNKLPQHVVDAPTVNAFKNRYDLFTRQDKGI